MTPAAKQHVRNRIAKALRALGLCCNPPLAETLWPRDALLYELDFAVVDLVRLTRKKPITVLTPYWRAYEQAHKREPQLRLIPRVKDLVGRADKLLKEAGESELVRLQRKASAGAQDARQLVEALRAIEEHASKAAEIDWEKYEGLLGGDKPLRLPYGDSARPGVRCYVRALQIIVDDLRYRRLLDKVFPLLAWTAAIDSPYAEMLKHNYVAQYCADFMVSRRAEETKARQQEQWRERQRRRRRKKLEAFLRAEGISEGEAQKFLAANA
jgi:hypothetical protein